MKGNNDSGSSKEQDTKQGIYRARNDSFSDSDIDGERKSTDNRYAVASGKNVVSNHTESTKSMSDVDSDDEISVKVARKKESVKPNKIITEVMQNGTNKMKEDIELQFAIEASYASEKAIGSKRKVDDLADGLNAMNVSLPAASVNELGDQLGQISMVSAESRNNDEEPSRKKQRRSDSLDNKASEELASEKTDDSDRSFVSRLGRSKSEPDFRKIVEEQQSQNSNRGRSSSF